MEPTHETDPVGTELPMPVPDLSSGTKEVLNDAIVGSPESSQGAPAQSAGSPQDNSTSPSLVMAPDPSLTSPVPSTPRVDDAALIADDADLIEKEWIVRAKAVVEQTKNDPYVQNRELNKVKAEYIKKRYNKDIKVSEE